MSRIDNIIKKMKGSPTSCNYVEIEKILLHFGFIKINAKGSHIKFKHRQLRNDLTIPVHKNECKDFYKKEAKKQINKIRILKPLQE